jgi:hypothetical protein
LYPLGMPSEQSLLLKKCVLAYRDDLLNENSRALYLHSVIDVIFFPYFSHLPMIRIDGKGMDDEEVASLEAQSELFLVRDPRYAGIVNGEVLQRLLHEGYASSIIEGKKDERMEEFSRLVSDLLKELKMNFDSWQIWEIEVHEQEVITIRLAVASSHARQTFNVDDLRIEILPEYQLEELKSLLGFFDACKKEGKPFLHSLYRHILSSEK